MGGALSNSNVLAQYDDVTRLIVDRVSITLLRWNDVVLKARESENEYIQLKAI